MHIEEQAAPTGKELTRHELIASTPEAGFIDEAEILRKVPVSRRTWGNWKAKGIVPFIKMDRRCLYDWASVKAALLRRQRGAE